MCKNLIFLLIIKLFQVMNESQNEFHNPINQKQDIFTFQNIEYLYVPRVKVDLKRRQLLNIAKESIDLSLPEFRFGKAKMVSEESEDNNFNIPILNMMNECKDNIMNSPKNSSLKKLDLALIEKVLNNNIILESTRIVTKEESEQILIPKKRKGKFNLSNYVSNQTTNTN